MEITLSTANSLQKQAKWTLLRALLAGNPVRSYPSKGYLTLGPQAFQFTKSRIGQLQYRKKLRDTKLLYQSLAIVSLTVQAKGHNLMTFSKPN
eukprot:3135190-Rhodomonas_salina.3